MYPIHYLARNTGKPDYNIILGKNNLRTFSIRRELIGDSQCIFGDVLEFLQKRFIG
jgi:hypothetical protein